MYRSIRGLLVNYLIIFLVLVVHSISGWPATWKTGKPGKVREFETYLENLEKSGNFIVGQGK